MTRYLATLMVIDHPSMLLLLKQYTSVDVSLLSFPRWATFLGVHSGGPYLSLKQKALMDPLCLRDPDLKELEQMKQAARGLLCVMAIAPERDGTLKIIEQESRSENPVRFMIGHSMASCRQAQEGLKAGARVFTHQYIVMSQHGHRDSGCMTDAFLDDVCFCELIVDGFHVHPDIIRATWKALGPDRIVLITDTMPRKGVPDGEYLFSGLRCVK